MIESVKSQRHACIVCKQTNDLKKCGNKLRMKRNKNYNRVMSRVSSSSRPSIRSSFNVTRHDNRTSQNVGAKPAVSTVSSSGFSELPIVLSDYVDIPVEKSKLRSNVRKPRKTLISLDPSLSPARPPLNLQKKPSARGPQSTPSIVTKRQYVPVNPLKESTSSRTHRRLKELQNEIRAYEEKEKLTKLQDHLHKTCGITLDDNGNPAEDKAIQVAAIGYGNSAPLTNGSAGSPLGRTAGSPPVTGAAGAGPSPMAALMSVADTLPPGSPRSAGGSPPQPPPQRSASRSSQHSPNSSGSNGGRRSSGSRHVSSTTSVSSTEAGEGADAAPPTPAPLLKCTLCQERLEDTHFVQCPSQPHHKFCFPCSRDSIKRQQGSEVYCPSGEKCPLANSTVPWAFMQGEIATILGEEFKPKKERET